MPLTLYTWTVIIFAFVFLVFLYMDRANFERKGIILIRRTLKGKVLVDRLAKRYPRFWRFYGNLGMILFIPAALITVALVAHTLYTLFTVPDTRGVGLLLPSLTPETKLLPGAVLVPFWFWLLGIVIIAVVHEVAHGIIARREKIKVKSLGAVLFGPILGAFVEIDEKQMARANWKTTARIASAGALTNMVFSGIFLIIFLASILTLYQTHGVGFAVDPSGPLNGTGIESGIIKSLGGVPIQTHDDLIGFLRTTEPNQTITMTYLDFNFTEHTSEVTLRERPDNQTQGYLGVHTSNRQLLGMIDTSQYRTPKAFPATTEFFTQFMGWLMLLNLLIGLFNLLPAKPLDGGLIMEAYARGFFPKKAKKIYGVTARIIYAMLIMLIFGIIWNLFL